MTDPSMHPERRHQTRAWKLMEALHDAPFGNEKVLAVIQAALDEERAEADRTAKHRHEHSIIYDPTCPYCDHVAQRAANWWLKTDPRNATEGL